MKKNSFSAHFLDRASSKRTDIHWIDTQLKNKTTAIIPVLETKVLCKVEDHQQPVFLSHKDIDEHSTQRDGFIFLGLVKGKAFFAYNIGSEDETAWIYQKNSSEFLDFRKVAPLLS
jgi:NADH pyrophosphatase NudC (nudix superfamily)